MLQTSPELVAGPQSLVVTVPPATYEFLMLACRVGETVNGYTFCDDIPPAPWPVGFYCPPGTQDCTGQMATIQMEPAAKYAITFYMGHAGSVSRYRFNLSPAPPAS